MPISRRVRITRTAISPRLAIRTLRNMKPNCSRTSVPSGPAQARCGGAARGERMWTQGRACSCGARLSACRRLLAGVLRSVARRRAEARRQAESLAPQARERFHSCLVHPVPDTNPDILSCFMNRLYYGDTLPVLRGSIDEESVDLIYLDPPFNSQATYNVLFKSTAGEKSQAQIEAFEDTWHWSDEAELAFDGVMSSGNSDSAEMLRAMRDFLKENDMMAYLSMMAVRLLELRRVLKTAGSLYLHCDPTASHYLKLILDAVFGVKRYVNEIIWQRTSAHGNATRKYAAVHDTLLFYSKSDGATWSQSFTPYSEAYIAEHFVHTDSDGRRFRRTDLRNPGVRPNLRYDYLASNGRLYRPHPNGWAVSLEVMKELDRQGRLFFPAKEDARLRKKIYLDESPGVPVTDVWDDLPPIHSGSQERLGYPTQKPQALLERIISASSDEGDVVLDPFCGCGTSIHAAQKLKREWIGIDITQLAISLIEKRLKDAFPGITYEVHGDRKSTRLNS